MEMEEDNKTLKDYLQIAKRRKYLIALPMLILMIISAVIAVALPPLYRSEALILIEQQHIPTDLVKSTVESFADERIKQIEQRVMTVDNLNKIIDKFELYSDLKDESGLADLADEFKINTQLTLVNADVIQNGRNSKATLAFKLSFSHKNAAIAQKVASELLTLFLNENVRNRTEQASETTRFLEEEAEKFKTEIQKIENQIAEFKEKYSNSLPELLQVNLSSISRVENEIQQIDLNEKLLNERLVSLHTQLAATSPSAVASGPNASQDAVPETLPMLKEHYQQLLTKYAASHPDVKAVKRKIDNFKGPETSEQSESTQGISNPVYLQLKSEIDIGAIELKNIKTQKASLQEKLQQLELRVSQTHQVERGYDELMRDLDNHRAKYKELKAKALEAKLSQTLEEEQKGEKFSLIEPPRIPSKPEKPDRIKILLLGFALSVGAGIGTGFLAEMLDGSIRGHAALKKLTGLEPLVIVPYIENQDDWSKHRRNKINFSIMGCAFLIGIILALHFFYMPLDTLWIKVWTRISLL